MINASFKQLAMLSSAVHSFLLVMFLDVVKNKCLHYANHIIISLVHVVLSSYFVMSFYYSLNVLMLFNF